MVELIDCLTPNITVVLPWSTQKKLVSLDTRKKSVFHLLTELNMFSCSLTTQQHIAVPFFYTKHLWSILIFEDRNWSFSISYNAKLVSSRSGLYLSTVQFFSLQDAICILRLSSTVCNILLVYRRALHTALLNREKSQAARLISYPPLTDCLLPFNLCRSVTSISLPRLHPHSAQDFPPISALFF